MRPTQCQRRLRTHYTPCIFWTRERFRLGIVELVVPIHKPATAASHIQQLLCFSPLEDRINQPASTQKSYRNTPSQHERTLGQLCFIFKNAHCWFFKREYQFSVARTELVNNLLSRWERATDSAPQTGGSQSEAQFWRLAVFKQPVVTILGHLG